MRRTLIAGAALSGAVAIAAAAIAGGGGFTRENLNADDDRQTATTDGPVQTNSKQFKRIPGAAPVRPAPDPDGLAWIDSATVTVTVVLKSGRGKLRVIDGPDDITPFGDEFEGTVMYPPSVSIAGKGPHTVQFILNESQDLVFPPEPQWKRTGNAPLKATTVVTSIEGEVD